MFNNLSNSKFLLVSSSIGFRAPYPIGSRLLPFRLKVFSEYRTPWILDYYSSNCLRLYKTGFTLVDFLIYLEKYNIDLGKIENVIFNFGIVEGWTRDNFDDKDDGEASWYKIIDRILFDAKGTKYYIMMNEHKEKVIKDNLTKTILSEDLFKILLLELLTKMKDSHKILFIIFEDSLYKSYTRKSICAFNNIIKNIAIKNKCSILSFTDIELYDSVHLSYKAHKVVSEQIKNHFSLKKIQLGTFEKFIISCFEYMRFRKYNINNFFIASITEETFDKINAIVNRSLNYFKK